MSDTDERAQAVIDAGHAAFGQEKFDGMMKQAFESGVLLDSDGYLQELLDHDAEKSALAVAALAQNRGDRTKAYAEGSEEESRRRLRDELDALAAEVGTGGDVDIKTFVKYRQPEAVKRAAEVRASAGRARWDDPERAHELSTDEWVRQRRAAMDKDGNELRTGMRRRR